MNYLAKLKQEGFEKRSKTSGRFLKGNQSQITHGQTIGHKQTKTYVAWNNMLGRCNNPKSSKFRYYGGRGISVCEKWQSFASFYEDMGEAPENMSLDRIDNNGNYSKENCRWATGPQQAENKRNTRLITHKGETHPLNVWAKLVGIRRMTLKNRLNSGWTISDALELKPRQGQKVKHYYHELV